MKGFDLGPETKNDLKFVALLFLLLVLFAVVFISVSPACFAESCTITANPGDWVRLDVYYWHEGGSYYSAHKGTSYPSGVPMLYAEAEGHPTAATWKVNGNLARQCGKIPVFHDNFEKENLDRWSVVQN